MENIQNTVTKHAWPILRALFVICGSTFAAIQFYAVYFPLNEQRLGGPGDFGPYAAVDWIGVHWLLETGEIPRWNPYLRYGVPYIGDAYISLFNPFASIPFALLGPIQGAKIAVVIAVALAGIGQYVLARTLKQHWVTAMFAAGMGLTAGSLHVPVGTGFAFGATLQHAWIAFTLASAIRLVRVPSAQRIAFYGLSSAFLFHSGNMYYWVGTEVIILGLFATQIIRRKNAILKKDRLAVKWLVSLVFANVLVLMLWSPQLFPAIDLRALTQKPIDVTRKGTLPILITLIGFVIPDRQFWANGMFGTTALGWAVHYSYIGATCFLFAPFGVIESFKRRHLGLRTVFWGFVAMILVASLHRSFLAPVVDIFPSLDLFRHWGTLVAVATVCLIAVLGEGAESAWVRAGQPIAWLSSRVPLIEIYWRGPSEPGSGLKVSEPFTINLTPYCIRFGVLALGLLSIADPWLSNRGIPQTAPRNIGEDEVFTWVRQQNSNPMLIYSHDLIYSHANAEQLRSGLTAVDSVWPFQLSKGRLSGRGPTLAFTPTPEFALTFNNGKTVEKADSVAQFPAGRVWRMHNSVPFAFLISSRDLTVLGQNRDLTAGPAFTATVQPASARFLAPHRLEVSIPTKVTGFSGDASFRLVVLQGWMPAWNARVVGGDVKEVDAVGEFISVDGVRAGQSILLEYEPFAWKLGGLLGSTGLILVVLLLAYGNHSRNLRNLIGSIFRVVFPLRQ